MSSNEMAAWVLRAEIEGDMPSSVHELLSSAQRTWPSALVYAQKQLPSHWQVSERASAALELWEKVLRSVAGTLHRKRRPDIVIADLDAYLMGVFKHRLHRVLATEKKRQLVVAFVSPDELAEQELPCRAKRAAGPERDIQIKQIVTCMDDWAKEVWIARMYGYSWSDIGKMVGVSEAGTKMRFRYALSKIRDELCGPK